MALLDKLESMKQRGMSDMQIMTALKEEGYSPLQVNEAFSQSKIKSAVSKDNSAENQPDLQPSIMQPEQQTSMSVPSPDGQSLQVQSAQSQQAYASQPIPQYTQEQSQYENQQQYPQYSDPNAQYSQEGYYQQGLDLETVRDIAKQEIEQSLKKIKDQVNSLEKMKTDLSFEVQNMDNRLNKIESVMQELQSAIIRKMGEYGESIQGISQEIKATQKSFSKMIDPLLDKRRGFNEEDTENEEAEKNVPERLVESNTPKSKPQKQDSREKNSISFEDYLGR